ncbi:hypothetical protein [Vibrio ostreicida]
MNRSRMELPTGQLITPQQILAGIGLLEIKTSTQLLKLARCISGIKR